MRLLLWLIEFLVFTACLFMAGASMFRLVASVMEYFK